MSFRKAIFLFATSFFAFQSLASSTCETATVAVEGVNHVPATDAEYYWYSFTMPREGKLVIDSESGASAIVYSNTCALQFFEGEGLTNIGVGTVKSGKEVFIRWNLTLGHEDFDWSLSIEELVAGDNSQLAVVVVEGANTVPATNGQYFWNSYTFSEGTKLIVTPPVNHYASVYYEMYGYLYHHSSVNKKTEIADFDPGEKAYIRWDTRSNGGEFEWGAVISELVDGDNCNIAKVAVDGDNHVPETSNSFYWYSYVMPADGKLTINSQKEGYIDIYTGTCSTLDQKGTGLTSATAGLPLGAEAIVRFTIPATGGDFDWELSVVEISDGDVCENPIEAVEAINITPENAGGFLWYHFTVPREGKVSIAADATRTLNVYKGGCSEQSIMYDPNGSIDITTLQVGDEILLQWSTGGGESFSWELAVQDFEPGDDCLHPAAAVEGTNSLPPVNLQNYWYSYTMPADGNLVVHTTNSSSVVIYKGSCGTEQYVGSGTTNLGVPDLSQGDELQISWNTLYSNGAFDWELSVESTVDGETCSLAKEAVLGSNYIPATNSSYHWYAFTMPSNGKLAITSIGSNGITVYKNPCDPETYIADNFGKAVITSLKAGDEILIRLATSNGGSLGDFSWSLAIEDFTMGDICQMPFAASLGDNTVTPIKNQFYWYQFTMPEKAKLVVTIQPNTNAVVYAGNCDASVQVGYGSGSVFGTSEIDAGQNVSIRIENRYASNYVWKLAVEGALFGETCLTAVDAAEESNTLPVFSSQYYYYSFTAPRSGKLVVDSEAFNGVDIFSSCENQISLANGNGKIGLPTVAAGESYIIRWSKLQASEISWNLSVDDIEAGDVCETAIEAVEGTNEIPQVSSSFYWYHFTMPSDGKLTISSDMKFNDVVVYKGDCQSLSYLQGLREGVGIPGLEAGEMVWIKWQTKNGTSLGNFQWNLSVTDGEPGDSCQLPAIATAGTNHFEVTYNFVYWHTFTMPETGNISISSPVDASIIVYSGNCSSLTSLGSSNSSVTIAGVDEGEVLYISWLLYFTHGDFDWTIAVEPTQIGDSCENAVAVSEGVNSVPTSSAGSYWARFAMPNDGKLVVSRASDNAVDVLSGCENPTYLASSNGKAATSKLLAGQEVIIRWSTDASSEIGWNLAVEEETEGDICSLARPALLGVNHMPDVNAGFQWYYFTMPEAGKLSVSVDIPNKPNDMVQLYKGDCDNLVTVQSGKGIGIVDLNAGEELFVRIQTQYNNGLGGFDWSLTVSEPIEGDLCTLAVPANIGTNHIPVTYNQLYWTSFTANEAGNLKVNSSVSTGVSISEGLCGNLVYAASGFSGAETYVEGGETYFIIWQTRNVSDFDWTISIEEPLHGAACDFTAQANIGENTIPATHNEYWWYEFTMPQDGKLVIDSETTSTVAIQKGTCDEGWFQTINGQGGVEMNTLTGGESVFIQWHTSATNGNFPWTLSVVDFADGESCATAMPALIGENQVSQSAVPFEWFSFTMPRDGKLSVSAEGNHPVSVHKGTCPGMYVINDIDGHVEVTSLASGDEILMKWQVDAGVDFKWNLQISDFEAGDFCNLPIAAAEGVNTDPSEGAHVVWYDFTMPQNGDLIVRPSGEFGSAVVYKNCDGNDPIGQGNEVIIPQVTQGESFLIKWYVGGPSWELEVKPAPEGESCEMAKLAVEGINDIPETLVSSYWYKFVMPFTGKLMINSIGTNSVGISREPCEEYVSFIWIGFGSATVVNLVEGEEILIEMQTENEGVKGGFSWTLSVEEFEEGDSCDTPFTAELGENQLFQDIKQYQWYKYKMPEPGKLVVDIPLHGRINVYKAGCDIASYLGGTGNAGTFRTSSIPIGEEIFIRVDNRSTAAETWNLEIEQQEKQPQQITFTPSTTVTYGQTVALNATASSQLPVSYEVVSGPATIEGGTLKPTGAGTVSVKGIQAGDTYYYHAAEPVTKEIQVQKAALTVTAADKAMIYGGQLPEFTYSVSGFVNDETAAVIIGSIAAGLGEGVTPTAGEHEIIPSGGAADNYTFNYVKGKLTVSKASQTITFAAIENTDLSKGSVALTATSSSGLAISYAVEGPASVSENTLTFTGAGEVMVTASQQGDNNYLAAEAVTITFIVIDDSHKQSQTITFALPESVYTNDSPLTLNGTSTSELPITYVVAEGPATVDGNVLTITGTGTVKVTASQSGDEAFKAAESVTATMLVRPLLSISGSVAGKDGEVPEGTVVASFTGGVSAGSSQLTNGQFTISGLKDGGYYLKYVPSATFLEKYRTTYYAGAEFGSAATKTDIAGQNVSGLTWSAIAKATATEIPQGNGSVSGSVMAGGSGGRGVRVIVGRTYDDGTPLEGITVYLLRASDNSIFKEAVTDAGGRFTITGLPSGSYKFHVDVPGISMGADNPVIELDETKPLELTAVVSDEGIAAEVVVIKGLEEEQMAVLVFPNPVSDVLNIHIDGEAGNLLLKVFNLLGQEQLQLQIRPGLQTIDLSKQPRGIYILTIHDPTNGRLLRQVKLKKE